MFQKVEALLEEMVSDLKTTNKILAQIEENLRVPNMVEWADLKWKSKE